MAGKTSSTWNIICLLLAIAALAFLLIHPLNCSTDATSPISSLLRLFCR
jgi:hypothetical protein